MTGDRATANECRVIVGRQPGTRGRAALRYAVGLARMYRCPLFVVDVVAVRPPSPWWPIAPVAPERLRVARQMEVAQELDVAAGDALNGVDVRIAVVRGTGAATLGRLADRPGDRLVVASGQPRPRASRRRAATLVV